MIPLKMLVRSALTLTVPALTIAANAPGVDAASSSPNQPHGLDFGDS